ncbi:hypothetical protein NL676_007059 [Syzygium grande]|nr:hypothetical protein NL676_007059 [Syzygium grande]
MEGDPNSKVEYEIVEDEEEHEELGGLAFEPEVVDPVPEQVNPDAPEPMDIDEHEEEQDPEPETESEDMSSEEDQEQAESSAESLGSDPDWVP